VEESSCECGNEPLGSLKCWETIEFATQPVAHRVVLSSIYLVVNIEPYLIISVLDTF
jgi:hypothetical protein